ncbi:ABC transporter permease [Actinobacteria bacterium YIM 96077]|uniref:ABC transporter permease n=1 Tax=Phytoactinopolyspora halophila TaxID=1981511 RepID=A0A329QVH9_9ACTN|nr:ABC transporter permease [Phytoactinopolyspora halophila]AYY13787.1 ABC transporter permease [Actinobacteria bacterium YIM 96077]RAW15669.1 ABC transporter permease [Phytoactinopolyspora halophila]
MLKYIARRLLVMIPTLFAISLASFFIIQLPPGDFLTTYAAGMGAQDNIIAREQLAVLEERYGLDEPFHVQYWRWISNIVCCGDFGQSFEWNQPVSSLIWDRLTLTMLLAVVSTLFTWLVAFLIGTYSAVRQYSLGDYFWTFIGFIGLATPNFLLALVLMYISFRYFGQSVGGLFSPEYQNAPWSLGKAWDLFQHLWIPVVIIATAGAASTIRIMRANLLDELHRPYTTTARAKGMQEWRLIAKYPLRLALNPFISTVGWTIPTLVSGEIIVSVVLDLPTTGPLLLRALSSQDMYLAGSFLMMLGVLTLIGTLLSDILLAWLDPRIQYEKAGRR